MIKNILDHRFYMGRLKCAIVNKCKKKALVFWEEVGVVGNNTEGYKRVFPGERDIVPIRMLWRRPRNES